MAENETNEGQAAPPAGETPSESTALDNLIVGDDPGEEAPQPEAETPPPPPAPEPETPAAPEPPKHDFDKGLQALQQRQADFERRLSGVLERIEAQGGRATPQQAAQAQAIKDELDDLASGPADKLDPYAAIPALAKRLKSAEAALNAYREQDEQRTQTLAASVADVRSRHEREAFDRDHPELKGKFDDLVTAAREKLKPWESDPSAYRAASGFVWRDVINEAKASAKPPTTPIPAAPLSREPAKPTAGTRVAPTGAAAKRPNPAGSKKTEEELLDALVDGD